jgi:arsenate reductase-like glutaredoxin family protein
MDQLKEHFKEFTSNYHAIKDFLLKSNNLSYQNIIEENFKKSFLLSCASYHENRICHCIESFFTKKSGDEKIIHFAKNKGISRQYHTYFDWKASNVNRFISLFGVEFKKLVSKDIESSFELEEAVKAFLEIGNERNMMVHENYLDYNLSKTFEEIEILNSKALFFIRYLQFYFEIETNPPVVES